MEKILILGISSFGGSSTASLLLEKKNFIIGTFRRKKNVLFQQHLKKKNNKNYKEYKIDFDLNKDLKKLLKIINIYKPKYIIDFASICMVNESWKYPNKYFKSNLENKSKLIEELCKIKFIKKYIYISTPEIFGSNKQSIKEDSKSFNPSTPYAISKLAFELLLNNYGKEYNFPFIICRFSNFFGIGQPNYRLIPKVFLSIFLKKKFYLDGKGYSKRNFIENFDFANGLYLTLLKGKVKNNYHFSTKEYFTIKKIVKTICKLKKVNPRKFINYKLERKGKDQIYKLDCQKTMKVLGWRAKINFNKSLELIDIFYKKNFERLKKLNFTYKDKNLSIS